MSSSLLLFLQCFGRYVIWPSGVCQTRKPSLNFELCPLLNPQGGVSLVLIPLAITGYKCQVFLYCYSPTVRIEPATSRWLSPEKLREPMPITVTLCILLDTNHQDSSQKFRQLISQNIIFDDNSLLIPLSPIAHKAHSDPLLSDRHCIPHLYVIKKVIFPCRNKLMQHREGGRVKKLISFYF